MIIWVRSHGMHEDEGLLKRMIDSGHDGKKEGTSRL